MFLGGRTRLDNAFPDRLHNLGRWGLACNGIAIVFMLQAMVVYCFPNEIPVTPQNMNYGELGSGLGMLSASPGLDIARRAASSSVKAMAG
jgi:hypothetical protein